jgi:membrane associated rhomboid family serine protease
MISLVTQSDGSSRRVPWITLALAVGLAAGFSSTYDEMSAAQAQADSAMAEAIQYFHDQPYLRVSEEMEPYLTAESAEALHQEWLAGRAEVGIHSSVPDYQVARGQAIFDRYVLGALGKQAVLPAARHGFLSLEEPASRFFGHFFFHTSVAAFAVALGALLLFGIPLEDVWGPIASALFAAVMIPLGAAAAVSFQPGPALPWLGGSALAAALLGASVFRWSSRGSPRLLGGIPLSPLWVVPGWAVLEFAVVRGFTLETLQAVPFSAFGAMAAAGFGVALLFRALGVEETLAARWEESDDDLRDPVYEKAMVLREKGKRDEALLLLTQNLVRKPDRDTALAIWDIARDLGEAERGVGGASWILNDALKRGQSKVVAQYWNELVEWTPSATLGDATFHLRIADALLREEEKEACLVAIGRAIDGDGLSGKLALRGVKMAEQIDKSEARALGERVIADVELSTRERSDLEARLRLLPKSSLSGPPEVGERRARRGETVETVPVTKSKLERFSELRAASPQDAPEPGFADQAEPEAQTAPEEPTARAAADLADPIEGVDADFDVEALDPNALDLGALSADSAFLADPPDPPESFDAREPSSSDEVETAAGDEVERWNSPGLLEGLEDEPEASRSEEALASLDPDDFELDGSLRSLQMVVAIPLALRADAIDIEIEGRGKSRLRLERIEAIAVAAVRGLADKPVVLIDLVLNWLDGPDAPLRVLRIRSDRFDPCQIAAEDESGVAALRSLVSTIADASSATCLPDAHAVRGDRFPLYDDLATYERDVLQAES